MWPTDNKMQIMLVCSCHGNFAVFLLVTKITLEKPNQAVILKKWKPQWKWGVNHNLWYAWLSFEFHLLVFYWPQNNLVICLAFFWIWSWVYLRQWLGFLFSSSIDATRLDDYEYHSYICADKNSINCWTSELQDFRRNVGDYHRNPNNIYRDHLVGQSTTLNLHFKLTKSWKSGTCLSNDTKLYCANEEQMTTTWCFFSLSEEGSWDNRLCKLRCFIACIYVNR